MSEVFSALLYPIIGIILVLAYLFYMKRQSPNGINTKWDMSHPQARNMAEKLFRFMPGENMLHQSVGHVDPNAHVQQSTAKTVGLAMMGTKLKDPVVMNLVLTDKGRFIIAPFDHRVEPLIFDKAHVPKIRDTGLVGRFPKISWIDTQEGRILEFKSDLIPYLNYKHANAENMELTVPNDFIPHIMNWVKQIQEKDDF